MQRKKPDPKIKRQKQDSCKTLSSWTFPSFFTKQEAVGNTCLDRIKRWEKIRTKFKGSGSEAKTKQGWPRCKVQWIGGWVRWIECNRSNSKKKEKSRGKVKKARTKLMKEKQQKKGKGGVLESSGEPWCPSSWPWTLSSWSIDGHLDTLPPGALGGEAEVDPVAGVVDHQDQHAS